MILPLLLLGLVMVAGVGASSASGTSKTSKKKITIAVMGPTGSGKSSFIRNLTKNQSIEVGHGLHSSKERPHAPERARKWH